MTVITERLSAKDYAPKQGLPYLDVHRLYDTFKAVNFRGNHILAGPKGIGKSLSVQSYAAKIDCPIITYDCSEDVRRSNLIGTFVIRGDDTPFILGPIPSAFEAANEAGRAILLLEEINALTPQAQKILNPITDFRRRVEVPEVKRIFELQPGKELWVVGTMNGSVYGGTYSLNEDLKSRFRLIPVTYPMRMEEIEILGALTRDIKDRIPPGAVEKVVLLAHETRQGAIEYPLSTRDLVQILEDIAYLGLQKALYISTGKFEGADVDAYKHRVESIFDDVELIYRGKEKDESYKDEDADAFDIPDILASFDRA